MRARTRAHSATCYGCAERPRLHPNERTDGVLHRYLIGWANRHAKKHPGHRVIVHLWKEYRLSRTAR